MERYNLADLTKRIYESGLSFFNLKTLKDILEIKKESSLFSIIEKFLEAGILTRVEKGKYLLTNAKISDFALANFLYQPSYVSFESALNFYGILSQFPYEVSSATTKKTVQKEFKEKIFTYTKIKKDLFWGYEKKENFLIAFPEKALLDQIYLASKGQKSLNFEEYNLENISLSKFRKYLNKYPKTRQFKSILEKIKKYL